MDIVSVAANVLTVGIDAAIIFAAVYDARLYRIARKEIDRVNAAMHPRIYKPSKSKADETEYTLADMTHMRRRINGAYTRFSDLTALFTTFGILGTVISLCCLQGNMGNIMESFTMALTSTLIGLVCFSVFRMTDIFTGLESDCEEAEKSIEDYIRNKLDGEANGV